MVQRFACTLIDYIKFPVVRTTGGWKYLGPLREQEPLSQGKAEVEKGVFTMSVCLDRYANGRPDPQEYEPDPVGECYTCGQEFYEGDTALEMPDGSLCCCSDSCMAKWAGANRRVM